MRVFSRDIKASEYDYVAHLWAVANEVPYRRFVNRIQITAEILCFYKI